MDSNDLQQVPMDTPPSPNEVTRPSMSSPIPLQLSGFLSGDTIQVRGDTGDLQFSVRLDIHKKLFPEEPAPLDSLDTIPYSADNFPYDDATFSPTYLTPVASREFVDTNEENSREAAKSSGSGGGGVMTRLRSGAISRPVSYFPRITLVGSSCERVRSRKRSGREKGDALERVLRRRSCPVRPCNSYAFFVMSSWAVAGNNSSSFGETSKRLGQMWCKLPSHEKKVYEEMALKDNARYKWQANLFMNNKDDDVIPL